MTALVTKSALFFLFVFWILVPSATFADNKGNLATPLQDYINQYSTGLTPEGTFIPPSSSSTNTCSSHPQNLFQLICLFTRLLNAVIPLIIGVALVGFLWGVAQFILAAEDATKRKEGSQLMLYGIIALFVMISVWGLVNILAGTFGVNTSLVPRFPGLQ